MKALWTRFIAWLNAPVTPDKPLEGQELQAWLDKNW